MSRTTVNTVLNDLRPAESISQCIQSLMQLQTLTDQIFGSISSRIKEEEDKLTALTTKIGQSDAKIAALVGSTKPTTVYSPANYPAADLFPEARPTVFESVDLGKRRYNIDVVKHPHRMTMAGDTTGRTQKKYHLVKEREDLIYTEGLGDKFPRGVKAVSSLLLYNTNVSPYLKYVVQDNLKFKGVKRENEEAIENESNSPNFGLNLGGTDKGFNYNPVLQSMPDNRGNLANLPFMNIAQMSLEDVGVQVSKDEFMSIAPTATPDGELPTLVTVPPPNKNAPTPSSTGAPPSAPALATNAPPPPPPPGGAPPPPPPLAGNVPPPPPPPPAPGGAPPPPPPPALSAAPPGASSAGRGSLLDAIRAGASLKKVDLKEVEKKKEAEVTGGGLFATAEFMKKIARRRVAIAGGGPSKSKKKKDDNIDFTPDFGS